ncbi:hypothetical protein Fcan01_24454 [Folsomia candida]|uniref:Uncharacterized protein n=1 Tax=Folsomia candida TaxID=158441 RepID=A0A226D6P2_FOLCA|nr:hypothetical protein Fcan01_24454 [Folsomia candida]
MPGLPCYYVCREVQPLGLTGGPPGGCWKSVAWSLARHDRHVVVAAKLVLGSFVSAVAQFVPNLGSFAPVFPQISCSVQVCEGVLPLLVCTACEGSEVCPRDLIKFPGDVGLADFCKTLASFLLSFRLSDKMRC